MVQNKQTIVSMGPASLLMVKLGAGRLGKGGITGCRGMGLDIPKALTTLAVIPLPPESAKITAVEQMIFILFQNLQVSGLETS